MPRFTYTTLSSERILSVLDKYISIQALPNDPIVAWVKWEDTEFDNLILRTEADIEVTRMLNVSENVWQKNPDKYGGMFMVDKASLEVSGFFGFVCRYTKIPESDRKITFNIDFVKSNARIEQLELTTQVIVPQLKAIAVSSKEITITDYSGQFAIEIALEKTGKAVAINVRAFWEIIRGSEKVRVLVNGKQLESHALITEQTDEIKSHLEVKGIGYVLIRLGFQYQDLLGNKYKTNVAEFMLDKRSDMPSQIPVTGTIEGDRPLLLAQS